jgi:RNA polymerase-binding protein DksA
MKATSIPSQWAWHHRTLTKLRNTLKGESDDRTAEAFNPLPRGGNDPTDIAEEEIERETLLAALAHEQAELVEIEAALQRIQRGTYGICEATGLRISPERLRAVPWTRFCQSAAQRRDRKL